MLLRKEISFQYNFFFFKNIFQLNQVHFKLLADISLHKFHFKILLSSTVNGRSFSFFSLYVPSCIEFQWQMWLKRFNNIEKHAEQMVSMEDLLAHFTINMTNPLEFCWLLARLPAIFLIYQQFIEFKYFATFFNTVTYLPNYALIIG